MKTNKIDLSYVFTFAMALSLLFFYAYVSMQKIPNLFADIENAEIERSSLQRGVSMGAFSFMTEASGDNDIKAVKISSKNTFANPLPFSNTMPAVSKPAKLSALDPQELSQLSEEEQYMDAVSTAVYPASKRPADVDGFPALYPELRKICACESSYHGTSWDAPRHFEDGKVLRNYSGNDDVGMCQINLSVYGKGAKSLGYDLYTAEGNIRFANWLFEQKGSAPWYKSKPCWGKVLENTK